MLQGKEVGNRSMEEAHKMWVDTAETGFSKGHASYYLGLSLEVIDALVEKGWADEYQLPETGFLSRADMDDLHWKLMDFAYERSYDKGDWRTPAEILNHESDVDHEMCEESCESR